MNKTNVAAVVSSLRPGMTVYVPGMSGESLAFYAALQADPAAVAGVRFVGVHFPGINHSDYLGLHPQAQQRAYFMQPGLRQGLREARAEWLPLDYPGIYQDLSEQLTVDLALVHLTPPDEQGYCSLGPSLDFQPAVWRHARRRVAHINPRLPRVRASFQVNLKELDAFFEVPQDVLHYELPQADTNVAAQAEHVASLVEDGDTLEFGIGKLPSAVLSALRDHRRLRVYSGMVNPALSRLLDNGAIIGSVECGVALGDDAFYQRIAADDRFLFRPVSETHDVRRIAAIASFCAINSAVEVDLLGQVNADTVKGRCVAGVGGLPAFIAGARLSAGGKSIIALPSVTDNQQHSRIVAQLSSPVAATRHEADYVVTEHGIARLRGLSARARAAALIAIAAPQFREALLRQWTEMEQQF